MLERFHCAGIAVCSCAFAKEKVCECLEGEIRVYVHFRNAMG